MGILYTIRQCFRAQWTDALAANLVFYPDKIIVQTLDYTKGPCVITDRFTILSGDVPPGVLGQTLKKHLALSKQGVGNVQAKKAWKAYQKAAGFQTDKESSRDAKLLTCRQKGRQMVLTPTDHTRSNGYVHRASLDIKLPVAISDHELGLQLIQARKLSNA